MSIKEILKRLERAEERTSCRDLFTVIYKNGRAETATAAECIEIIQREPQNVKNITAEGSEPLKDLFNGLISEV